MGHRTAANTTYPALHAPEHDGLCSCDELPKEPGGHGDRTPPAQKKPVSQGEAAVWCDALAASIGVVYHPGGEATGEGAPSGQ